MIDMELDCELLDCSELCNGGGVCCRCKAFCEVMSGDQNLKHYKSDFDRIVKTEAQLFLKKCSSRSVSA